MKMTKIYTRTGDKGRTSLVGGVRIHKSSARIEAYGTIDELCSHIGLLLAYLPADDEERSLLIRIQSNLFIVGSHLATDLSQTPLSPSGQLPEGETELLEQHIDRILDLMPEAQGFVLPGGTVAAAQSHVCRTVCRRAERQGWRLASHEEVDELDLRYLNRLSDYFFVLSRYFDYLVRRDETCWDSKK